MTIPIRSMRPRVRRRRGSLTLLAVMLGAALALSACTFTASAGGLDTAAVERDIEAGVQEQNDLTVTVDCPDQVPVQEGDSFECTLTTEDGSTQPVSVLQEPDGVVSWSVG